MNFVLGLLLVLAALGLLAALLMNKRARRSSPVLVEQYNIDLLQSAGAPARLRLTFHDESGRSSAFLMAPAYAHHLSDQLCQASALATRPKEVARGES